ncbi:hypothetical protein [Leifsonia xyli]|uniref:hypothetical protein n=1 Tax=Leifsonia xyli TaxID=1575 RepID=UPI003D674F37
MTDPRTRRPEYWRNFAWAFAGVAALSLAGGIVLVVAGSPTGWVNVGLGIIFASQAVLYFRSFRRAKGGLERGERQ